MSTQELRHSTRNFVKLAGDYLGELSPVCISMASWPRHIDRFKRQYDKAFVKGPSLYWTELLDQRVHVLMSTQELRHSTRNFVKLAGDYLGELGTLT